MRIIIILAFILPSFLNAQINRSATELARENIQIYIENKLFKDHQYKPVSYSVLKPDADAEAVWTINHTFEIITSPVVSSSKTTATSTIKFYKFAFYLDRKMEVFKAIRYSK